MIRDWILNKIADATVEVLFVLITAAVWCTRWINFEPTSVDWLKPFKPLTLGDLDD